MTEHCHPLPFRYFFDAQSLRVVQTMDGSSSWTRISIIACSYCSTNCVHCGEKITQYYGTVIKETLSITHLFCLIGIFKKWQHCLLVFTFPSTSSIDDLSSSWPLFLFSANRVYRLSTNFHPLFSLSVVICLLRSATTLNYRDPVKR